MDMPAWVGSSKSRMDVIRTLDSYVYFIDLPGVEKEDLEVSARGTDILIEAMRRPIELPDGGARIRSERPTGPFRRTIRVPADGDIGSVQARLKKGVLRIRVARVPDGAATRIRLED